MKRHVYGMIFRFKLLLAVLLMGSCFPAFAVLKCEAQNTSTLLTFGKDVAALKVSASTPIGAVLLSRQVDFNVACSLNSLTDGAELAYFKRKELGSLLGNGLTVYVTFNGNRGSAAAPISTGTSITNRNGFIGLPSSQWQQLNLSVVIEVVKTGAAPITPITVPTTLNLFTIDSRVIGTPASYFIQGANSTSFVNDTCLVNGGASFSVPMGSVTTSSSTGFGSGVGSVSADKSFAIDLTCDTALSGAFNIMMTLNGSAVTGQATNGVLALSNDTGAASGAGIQVLHGASQLPVTFGTAWKIGSFPLSGTAINVPFIARYYQTASTITPGVANGTMTYTIDYM
ncbi:fimbrial protein [Enterobacter mori]|uniref:fimbrial protein n=1 Tax=Enterobacter mori TaxID=539813 RepID=UPI001B8C44CD|nr:fimbrial protein [Enterobacter mori]MBS3046391.1 fimbrial protein [Enterobacter mori]